MAVYTSLLKKDTVQLAKAYGFKAIIATHPIAEGVENTNYLLEYISQAGVPQRAILTIFEQRVNIADLPFFLGLKKHLRAHGICCPLPYRTLNGESIVCIRDKSATIVSFLEGGSILQPTTHHIIQAGETLAKLHLAGQDFALSRANSMSFAGWDALRERIAARTITDEHKAMLHVIDTEIAYAKAHWSHDTPTGVIHADLFPNNVFFDANGTLSGVIDFYFACNDALAYDLAIVANAWCFDALGAFRVDDYHALVAAYDTMRPLNDTERALMPTLLRAAALRFLLTRFHDVLYHDSHALVTPHDPMEYLQILYYHQHNN